MLKQKKFFKLAFIMAIVLFSICIAVIQGIPTSAFALEETNKIATDFIANVFGKKVQTLDYLYNFDESKDFIYAEFEGGGYAVFYKDTFEPLEYSMTGRLKNSDKEEKIYYGGPANKFVKEQGTFSNLNTDERVVLTVTQSQEMAQSARQNFSQNAGNALGNIAKLRDSIENFQQQTGQNDTSSVPSYDESIVLGVDENAHYIPNYAFFLEKPIHGTNSYGTCSSVAVQLMLLYHNYFSDRRIIDDSYLFQDIPHPLFKDMVVNPNTSEDPMKLNSWTTGSQDSYYEYVISKVEPCTEACYITDEEGNTIHNHIGANAEKKQKGITAILADLKDVGVKGTSTYATSYPNGSISVTPILNEIDEGRPLIISLRGYLGGTADGKGGHAVVAYGYTSYTYPKENGGGTYQGYIAHMGWGDEKINVWVNSAWCDGYVKLEINHDHQYDEENYVGGTYREEKCKECGYRRYAYETNILSNTEVEIISTTQTCEEKIKLPNSILGRDVVRLGNNAFDGSNGHGEKNILKNVTLPENLREIGTQTFRLCGALESVVFPSTLKTIGAGAFGMCGMLADVSIPASVEELQDSAFLSSGVTHITFEEGSHLTTIRNSAFSYCKNLKHIRIPYSVWIIERLAFANCSSLETVALSHVPTIDSAAFYNTKNVTFYTSVTSYAYQTWSEGWNESDRPIVWGCQLKYDRVEYFTKSDENPSKLSGILNPRRYGYTFDGWYTTANFSGDSYATIASAPNGKLYANWKDGFDSESHISTGSGSGSGSGSCVAEGTMITLADGTQKAVETLTGDEQLLVWNLWTGALESAPILFVDSEPWQIFDVIHLTFSDGTMVKVIDEHGFWDVELNQYVYLRADASKYIGHRFKKETGEVILVSVAVTQEATTAWSPVTYGHLCYFVDGMLSMPGGIEGLFNIFEVDPDTMKIDEEKYLADVATYGLFTYEEFSELFEVSEEIFNAVGGQYLKVALGKGILTEEKIEQLIARYAPLFA